MSNIYFRDERSKSRYERDHPGALDGMQPYEGFVVGPPPYPHNDYNGIYIPKGKAGLEVARSLSRQSHQH